MDISQVRFRVADGAWFMIAGSYDRVATGTARDHEVRRNQPGGAGGLAIRSSDLRDTPLVGQGEDLLLPAQIPALI